MPLISPLKGETQSKFISRFMSNESMKKEYPDQKQRVAIAHSQWRKKHGGKKPDKKESIFCYIQGYENKESKDGELIKGGYIATTHLDSGWFDEGRNLYVRDRVAKETLFKWKDDLNAGNPRANKVSVHHNRESHVTGKGMEDTARVDEFPDGEYGLYVDTFIDKTKENFEKTAYRIDNKLLDSYSIEYDTGITKGEYYDGAVIETQEDGYLMRTLMPGTLLQGYTLASQPMNENCVMLKEVLNFKELKENKNMEKENKEEEAVVEKPAEETPAEPAPAAEEPKEEEKEVSKISKDDMSLLKEIKTQRELKEKEIEFKELYKKLKPELKEELNKVEVKEKVKTNPEKNMESKELIEYKEIFNPESKISVDRQFKIAADFAESKGMMKGELKTTLALQREFKNFATNGTYLEFKGLGVTTNQNTDTDYLLSAAELNDVFDPVIYNAINQKTITWNLLAKDDFSTKGNNQVQFVLKTAQNTSATAYTGNAVATGNVTRLKFMTKFKKYQVGVEVDGDMIAAARGGPIGDVFAQEVRDSTDDLMEVINKDLFISVGAETAAGVIGFQYIANQATNTTLYNLTRTAANKLNADAAADIYINGSSANLSITNLRAAKRQAVKEGASMNNLVFIGDSIQGDKLRSVYDAAQRPIPTSSRFGFEGMMTFDGIPFFEDKDCGDADVYLIDLETHRVAIWVPPTLEMLGKDADSQKGFIKTYFATYNRAPRRLVWIYSNKTT